MPLCAFALLAQLAITARQTPPVLAFPEPGLDDSASYQGYQTRFFKDAAGNTLQIYLEGREGRVVHLLADAENASIGFSVRGPGGQPVPLQWDGARATVSARAGVRTVEYALAAGAPDVHLGWFLLGSMRVERDFQYWKKHRQPYSAPPFVLEEVERALAALGQVDAAAGRAHLGHLNARDVATLRARVHPTVTTRASGSTWIARVVQPALDARDTLVVEIRADTRQVAPSRAGDSLSLRARSGGRVPFTVRISTTGKSLTPLARREIFTPEFLAFVAGAQRVARSTPPGDSARIRARWLERQVRGVELLVSREKLMAGLPAYATYFGRDMLVSALMMRSIWRGEMAELAMASALRRLSPSGEVSHEEALGGQALRETAAEYAAIVDLHLAAAGRGDRIAADSFLARAGAVMSSPRRVRENYHMIDDEFQLPVLAARWIADSTVPVAHKRAFLLDRSDGGRPRLELLLRELALVAQYTLPYARDPVAGNLVGFAPRDSLRWSSSSWRDSGVGYANGRWAMDVNSIWVPHALEGVARFLATLPALGFSVDSIARALPALAPGTPLGAWARDRGALDAAVRTWWGAERHFVVRLGPDEVRSRVAARLAAMPAVERAHWTRVLDATRADRDSLTFLALALDAQARPIGVANSDPATRLFLGDGGGAAASGDGTPAERVLRDVRLFVRPYPAGLFIDRVGPVVANDAYATPDVWTAFVNDAYHGPRVAWGREVNLFLLGAMRRIAEAPAAGGGAAYVRELREAMDRVTAAVEASGFQSELWSYDFRDGRPVPVRYGTGSDVQLWSTTDLAVQFGLWKLGR